MSSNAPTQHQLNIEELMGQLKLPKTPKANVTIEDLIDKEKQEQKKLPKQINELTKKIEKLAKEQRERLAQLQSNIEKLGKKLEADSIKLQAATTATTELREGTKQASSKSVQNALKNETKCKAEFEASEASLKKATDLLSEEQKKEKENNVQQLKKDMVTLGFKLKENRQQLQAAMQTTKTLKQSAIQKTETLEQATKQQASKLVEEALAAEANCKKTIQETQMLLREKIALFQQSPVTILEDQKEKLKRYKEQDISNQDYEAELEAHAKHGRIQKKKELNEAIKVAVVKQIKEKALEKLQANPAENLQNSEQKKQIEEEIKQLEDTLQSVVGQCIDELDQVPPPSDQKALGARSALEKKYNEIPNVPPISDILELTYYAYLDVALKENYVLSGKIHGGLALGSKYPDLRAEVEAHKENLQQKKVSPSKSTVAEQHGEPVPPPPTEPPPDNEPMPPPPAEVPDSVPPPPPEEPEFLKKPKKPERNTANRAAILARVRGVQPAGSTEPPATPTQVQPPQEHRMLHGFQREQDKNKAIAPKSTQESNEDANKRLKGIP